MELRFFTWNINDDTLKFSKQKSFFQNLNTHLLNSRIDVLVLQESLFEENIHELVDYKEVSNFLSGRGVKRWVRIFLKKDLNIKFTRLSSHINNKLRCVEFELEDGFRFNLMAVHFHSKAGKSEGQQMYKNKEVPTLIKEFESLATDKTMIVGDFNYTPFDLQFKHPDFIQTSNSRNIVKLFNSKIVNGKKAKYFYNPMWNVLGDYGYDKMDKPTGTYYWFPDDVEKSHWNLIDGVLLSESIMYNIVIESIEIHTFINDKQLLHSEINEKTMKKSLLVSGFSDHLPISFTFKTA